MADNYRGRIPRIRWGSGYTNALDLDGFDEPNAWSEPLEGSEFALAPSRAEDAWIVADDYKLEGVARWIPREDVLSPRRATGWGGSSGWDAALRWMRQKNTMKFHPDARNLVVSPKMDTDADANGVVNDFTFATSGTITATPSLDSSAQRVAASGAAAGAYADVIATIYGILPGETLHASVAFQTAALVTMSPDLLVSFLDSAGAVINTVALGLGASGTFARSSTLSTAAAPSNAARARVTMRLIASAASSSGTVWWRQLVLARTSGDAASFLDNPSYDAVLVEPMKEKPTLEMNHRRAVRLVLRSPTGIEFAGY